MVILVAALTVLVLTAGAVGAAAGIGGYLLYQDLSRDLVQLRDAREHLFETTRIYDRDGELLYEVAGAGLRTYVPLEAIPERLVQATVAAEDATFWTNPGFEPRAVLRAAYLTLRHRHIVSGGSTITQQLVRRVAMSPEEASQETPWRKAKEIALAFLLTQTRGKTEILELYLNEIYYGNRAYGVQAAAQAYFGKGVGELRLAEISLLAGLPQAPVRNDPRRNLERSQARQRYVLDRMVGEGYISAEEAKAAYGQPVQLVPERDVTFRAPHFVDYVRQLLEEELGPEMVSRGGLEVHTTLDLELNEAVQEVARGRIQAIRDAHHATNATVVVLQPGTGQILAMVGSVDYFDESIDGQVNVALRLRQPGSSIKPVTYAAALEEDHSPGIILEDTPTVIQLANGQAYQPVNYDRRFHGPVRMRTALANSFNVPAVKMLLQVGVPRFLEQARRMGVVGLDRPPSEYGPSITLGGGEVTLLGEATVYATLASLGRQADPVAILRVERHGQVLKEWAGPQPDEPAMDPRIAYILSDMLADDRARMPAFGAENPLDLPFAAAAKTGTTDDFRDNWTLGYTPNVVVGIWVGNSDNSPMIDVSGITGAAPIWRDVMLLLYQDGRFADLREGPEWFSRPEGLVEKEICDPVGGCWVELFLAENQEAGPAAGQQEAREEEPEEDEEDREKDEERRKKAEEKREKAQELLEKAAELEEDAREKQAEGKWEDARKKLEEAEKKRREAAELLQEAEALRSGD